MIRRFAIGGPVAGMLLALGWFVVEPALEPDQRPAHSAAAVDVAAAQAAAPSPTPVAGAAGASVQADDRDRAIFAAKLEFAREEGLAELPLGEAIARLGASFLGTPYIPGTLDPAGPERLVVNLRELDCVTFVESTLALSRVVRDGERDFGAFTAELERIRYRDGVLDGYPSRLHYFSDWIADNEAKGIVRNITRELGGIRDSEPIDFMSTHRNAYRQLGDAARFEAIQEIEAMVSARPRYYIPEERIAAVAPDIRDGDIIAATSSVDGLDVAHTGIALWVDGKLHLLHAPLVGKSVEISELPLAERILTIDGQDGIMVARPI